MKTDAEVIAETQVAHRAIGCGQIWEVRAAHETLRILAPDLAARLAAANQEIAEASLIASTMEHGESCDIQIGMRADGSRYEAIPCDCGPTKLRAALSRIAKPETEGK